jgi:hypothetical protein
MVLLTPTLYLSLFGVRERRWFTRRSVEVELDLRHLPDIDPVLAVGDHAPEQIDLREPEPLIDLAAADSGAGSVGLPVGGTGRPRMLRNEGSGES